VLPISAFIGLSTRDVDGPDGTYRLNSVGQAGVEHRDELGPAVARDVLLALQLDEDDVGLVDAALRMLSAVVRHLDRNRDVTCFALVLQQLAGKGASAAGCRLRGTGWASHWMPGWGWVAEQ
jgi:hypothetical protein